MGKEWFHGSISREEVLDLLTHSMTIYTSVHINMQHQVFVLYIILEGEVGSFLVRLSSVDQSERHYSLSLSSD